MKKSTQRTLRCTGRHLAAQSHRERDTEGKMNTKAQATQKGTQRPLGSQESHSEVFGVHEKALIGPYVGKERYSET